MPKFGPVDRQIAVLLLPQLFQGSTCASRVRGYLAFHEGGTWGDDEINLEVDSEAVK